jgi:hypothetical protein
VDQRARAVDARTQLEAAAANGEPFDMIPELEASLVTIAAVTSSIDGMYWYLQDEVSPKQRLEWKAGRVSKGGVVAETFKAVTGMKGNNVSRDLKWVFTTRNRALHHKGEFRQPIPHPAKGVEGSVSWEFGTYTVETASRAVELALALVPWFLKARAVGHRREAWAKRFEIVRASAAAVPGGRVDPTASATD